MSEVGEQYLISGTLRFSASYNNTRIEDAFNVEVTLPKDYPDSPPSSRELGGRIPKDYHQYIGGAMCLGAPLDVSMKFAKTPTLVGFVESLLIPYLFSFVQWESRGIMPYGELSHGGLGLYEYYQNLFESSSPIAVLGLLKVLADGDYRGHLPCPCDSKNRLRSCHGPLLRRISRHRSSTGFMNDYGEIWLSLRDELPPIPKHAYSKALERWVAEQKNVPTSADSKQHRVTHDGEH